MRLPSDYLRRIRDIQTPGHMKRTAVLLIAGAVCALTSLALAKENNKGNANAAGAEHKIVTAADIKWMDGPPFLPTGVKLAVLEGDPSKAGPFTIRLQAPAGYKIPAHTHPTAEHITVISGTFHIGMGEKLDEAAGQEMSPGSFAVMPAGMKHFAWMSAETVVQVHGTGPFQIKYVNPADDPRGAKK
jgi:quercetin dioxygenase-like cupin family protein